MKKVVWDDMRGVGLLLLAVVKGLSWGYNYQLRPTRGKISMKDSSCESYFVPGDHVRVVTTDPYATLHTLSTLKVQKDIKLPEFQNKFNSSQFEGVVTEVWEKCEVDPHCCCAELAFDATITVTFNVTLSSYNEYGSTGSQVILWKSCYGTDELIKIPASKSTDVLHAEDDGGAKNVNRVHGGFKLHGKKGKVFNEVIIDVDQDVSYLGSYIYSKV